MLVGDDDSVVVVGIIFRRIVVEWSQCFIRCGVTVNCSLHHTISHISAFLLHGQLRPLDLRPVIRSFHGLRFALEGLLRVVHRVGSDQSQIDVFRTDSINIIIIIPDLQCSHLRFLRCVTIGQSCNAAVSIVSQNILGVGTVGRLESIN